MSSSTQADRLWSVSDVAEYLGIPTSSVYKMTARKATTRIPHVRIAGRLRFRKADIDHWLELLTVSNIEALERISSALRKRNGIDSPSKMA